MQITDKDLQQFRERAKTELQSNGAVGRLAWDAVVNALCNEVDELRKNAAISNAVDSDWAGICAACAEGTPPERCAYYGDPDGCNAPTLGKHPEGDLAERLQEALEKAERRIAELERAPGNAAAMRKALEMCVADYDSDDKAMVAWRAAKAALAAPARNCDVGTAEEQAERMGVFCTAHKYVGDDGTNWCSRKCPLYGASDCSLAWSQMPFDPAEGGEK